MQRKDFKEMKKTSHKNQIIITALAVMIVVAGYLNFTGQEISTSGLTKRKQRRINPQRTRILLAVKMQKIFLQRT